MTHVLVKINLLTALLATPCPVATMQNGCVNAAIKNKYVNRMYSTVGVQIPVTGVIVVEMN